MAKAEPAQPMRGAMAGTAPAVGTTGFVEPHLRPADWNSGDSNNAMYLDPAEIAWERNKQMADEGQTDNPGTEASGEDGSAQVQQPEMPQRRRGRPKKSIQDDHPRASRGVDVPVSDVPRDRDPHKTRLQAPRESRADKRGPAPAERSLLTQNGHAEGWDEAQRNQASLGFKAFERYIAEAPLAQAFSLYNEFSRRIIEAGNSLEDRRNREKQADSACSFCDHIFTFTGSDTYKARRAINLPDGRIQVVMACGKSKCLDQYDDYINEVAIRTAGNAAR